MIPPGDWLVIFVQIKNFFLVYQKKVDFHQILKSDIIGGVKIIYHRDVKEFNTPLIDRSITCYRQRLATHSPPRWVFDICFTLLHCVILGLVLRGRTFKNNLVDIITFSPVTFSTYNRYRSVLGLFSYFKNSRTLLLDSIVR